MPDRKLILTVGLPRSGKSTWAMSYSVRHGCPVVNPDSVRLAIHGQPFIPQAEVLVWAHVEIMVRSFFITGYNKVILDATNITRERRNRWRSADWMLLFREFTTPSEVCKQRALEKNRDDLVDVIDKMASLFEPLGPDETRFVGE